MAVAEEAPDRVGSKKGLERLLGMPKRHDSPILPLRLKGGPFSGGSTEAPDHSRRGYNAAYSRAS